jgi:hypothetical protein
LPLLPVERPADRIALSFECRRQISDSTLCVKTTAGQGSEGRHVHCRDEEIAHDQIEVACGKKPRQAVGVGARPVLARRIRQRIEDAASRVRIERGCALRRIAARDRVQLVADLAHSFAVCIGRRSVGKGEVRDVVAARQVPHQVPRT